MKRWAMRSAVLAVAAGLVTAPAGGQVKSVAVTVADRPLSSHVIVPQSRSFFVSRAAGGAAASSAAEAARNRIEITGVKVGVVILEQVATTTMEISLRNPGRSRAEAEMIVPVPDGAVVKAFTFEGAGKEPTAELLPKETAKGIYRDIVAKTRDPALLEFAGYNLIRSSVFPVEARGTQKVRLTYEHLLAADGDRVDYLLPRSESVDYNVPWEISLRIKSKSPIATVYSPSHQLVTERAADGIVSASVAKASATEPGPFQLSYLRQRDGAAASLMAYPDPSGEGGYFLLLASLPAKAGEGGPAMKRELTIVIDRSGSMAGEKIEQVRSAALQAIQGLEEGEAFNVIDYSDSVSSFASKPVLKTARNEEEARHYLRRLAAGGGTNLHDALLEALRPKPAEGMLPIVLFLTDGLPTVGVRDELTIRSAAEKANKYNRRIFTFGVGYDVNAPLLGRLADASRATSTFVLPGQNVEAKVSQVYRRLAGPVLADPILEVLDAEGKVTTRRAADLLPARLPDLYEGDNLLVLGKYKGDSPLVFRLRGQGLGKERTFQFRFELAGATNRNSFVPRLWASRKIAFLIEEIRQAGAGAGDMPPLASARPPVAPAADPRTRELVDEIVRLSLEFGILTEYTAFLAREGTDLTQRDDILRQANELLVDRAQRTRSGVGAVNQAANLSLQNAQSFGNRRNGFLDENMNRVQVARVQQVNDRAYFQQGNRWVDSQAIGAGAQAAQADRTVTVGTREFDELLDKLVKENRNGALAMGGEILLRVDGKNVLVKAE